MVEQDLIISRILVELFEDPLVKSGLVFRGGTALHKIFLPESLRYSEDIDVVQRDPGPIGPFFDAMRAAFDGWLGEPQRKTGRGVASLVYRGESEDTPPLPLRMKIEINTREHFHVWPPATRAFEVRSRWFEGSAEIPVYQAEELLGTKMRALYQRRKGRDLFDLAVGIRQMDVDAGKVVRAFSEYTAAEGHPVSQAEYRANLLAKLEHPGFREDCGPLLRPGVEFDLRRDFELVDECLIGLL